MPSRRSQRLARQLSAVLHVRYREATGAADALLHAAASAGWHAHDDNPHGSALLSAVHTPTGWRLLLLRGRTADVDWLTDPDPTLRTAPTGPTLIGAPWPTTDPDGHLHTTLLINGARASAAELHVDGLTTTAAYRADIPTTTHPACPRLPDTPLADLSPISDTARQQLTDQIARHLVAGAHDENLAAQAAAAVSSMPQRLQRALVIDCWHDAETLEDPAVIGAPTRYGWSVPDLLGGLPVGAPWPRIHSDALEVAHITCAAA